MSLLKTLAIIISVALMLGGCATKTAGLSSSAVMKQYSSISELKALLNKAEVAGTHYLAPDGFKNAQNIYSRAFDMASEQTPGANALAEKGLVRLRLALKHAATSRTILGEVLDAREFTMKAGAKIIYPDEFSKIESKLQDATVAIEDGKTQQAKKMRAELMSEYTMLEISSLKTSITKQAKAMIAKADKKDADEKAPKTFKLAEEEFALALDVLNAGRSQTQKSQIHANKSVYFSTKSIYITDMINNFDRRKFSSEDTILWYQQQLEIVNKPFNKSLSFDKPNYDVVAGIQDQIKGLEIKRVDSDNSLNMANDTIISLQGRIAMMLSEHGDVVAGLNKKMKGDNSSLKKQLHQVRENNKNAEARYKKIQAMFSDEEAYVYRQDNNVLLETHAFDFKVGGSEIDSRNYDLLEKIMQAINVFGNPEIMIMGHTDSTGSEALNQKLSQKRAQTVTAFLKKIGKYKLRKIETKGYGESRPVASNDTREGRARNRRIEVLIVNN